LIARQLAVEGKFLRSCVISNLLVVNILRYLSILAHLEQPGPQVVPAAALVSRRLIDRVECRLLRERGLRRKQVEAAAASTAGLPLALIHHGRRRHYGLRLFFDGSNQLLQHLLVAHEGRATLGGLWHVTAGLISGVDSGERRLSRCKGQAMQPWVGRVGVARHLRGAFRNCLLLLIIAIR